MGIGDFINGIISRAKAADGKIIGEDGEMIKSELAPDDRGAWVNHMAEQYLKKEVLDDPPPKFKIDTKDIVRELSKREIKKILGK